VLHVKHLSKSYGSQVILDDVSFVVNAGERVGLIGPNGAGKTTLLRCIVGEEAPDRGEVVRSPRDAEIGYLPQALRGMEALTIADAVAAAQREWVEAERALAESGARLADDASDAALAAYDAALARFEALGGYDREQRAAAILAGLGLGTVDDERPVASLSGGQKTRLGVALLLLREPDMLVLDEPTNHLDVEALVWLEGFLTNFPGAVLVVSHDREFLDRTVQRILFLDPETHQVRSYPGNYTAFAAARQQEAEQQREAWVRQQEYINRVRGDIGRLKGEAQAIERSTTPRQPGVRVLARKKAALAKAREKKLERFLESDERVEKPRPRWGLKLDFGEPPPGGRAVLSLEDVAFGYPGQAPLFTGVSFDVQHGDRIAVVGPNGSGKTTLLRLIEGTLSPTAGTVRLGATVRLGVLAQEQETLDPALSVLETALRERAMSETEARSFLHYFLFSGDAALRPVGRCSLGERARLQLALLVLRGCTLLLLDEPLNHLDIEGREHFAAALEAYGGTVFAVVHDRAFLRTFGGRIVALERGTACVYPGYEEYLEAGAW